MGLSSYATILLFALLSTVNGQKRLPMNPEEWLGAHNKYRAAANASDMQEMVVVYGLRFCLLFGPVLSQVWNINLERFALQWAKRCDFDHSSLEMRSNRDDFKYIGENLFTIEATRDTPPSAEEVVGKSWVIGEIPLYNYKTNQCKKPDACGHYTQVVWSESCAVGCAITLCKRIKNAPIKRTQPAYLAVCHYGPAGNVEGQQPYAQGQRCSSVGCQCTDKKLCVCKNYHQLCVAWAASGKCQQDEKYMNKYCQASCHPGCAAERCLNSCHPKCPGSITEQLTESGRPIPEKVRKAAEMTLRKLAELPSQRGQIRRGKVGSGSNIGLSGAAGAGAGQMNQSQQKTLAAQASARRRSLATEKARAYADRLMAQIRAQLLSSSRRGKPSAVVTNTVSRRSNPSLISRRNLFQSPSASQQQVENVNAGAASVLSSALPSVTPTTSNNNNDGNGNRRTTEKQPNQRIVAGNGIQPLTSSSNPRRFRPTTDAFVQSGRNGGRNGQFGRGASSLLSSGGRKVTSSLRKSPAPIYSETENTLTFPSSISMAKSSVVSVPATLKSALDIPTAGSSSTIPRMNPPRSSSTTGSTAGSFSNNANNNNPLLSQTDIGMIKPLLPRKRQARAQQSYVASSSQRSPLASIRRSQRQGNQQANDQLSESATIVGRGNFRAETSSSSAALRNAQEGVSLNSPTRQPQQGSGLNILGRRREIGSGNGKQQRQMNLLNLNRVRNNINNNNNRNSYRLVQNLRQTPSSMPRSLPAASPSSYYRRGRSSRPESMVWNGGRRLLGGRGETSSFAGTSSIGRRQGSGIVVV